MCTDVYTCTCVRLLSGGVGPMLYCPPSQAPASAVLLCPPQVLSSAESIAVGLATEKACSWLSANITGEVWERSLSQAFKGTGRVLSSLWEIR